VLGDRYGSACSPVLTRLVDQVLTGMGFAVARNVPYAGGYTTEHYGRPMDGVHALQIEINRALYMDESQIQPGPGFLPLQRALARLIQALSQTDWAIALGQGRCAMA
jgi:N-formylglutamate amidohydrolase